MGLVPLCSRGGPLRRAERDLPSWSRPRRRPYIVPPSSAHLKQDVTWHCTNPHACMNAMYARRCWKTKDKGIPSDGAWQSRLPRVSPASESRSRGRCAWLVGCLSLPERGESGTRSAGRSAVGGFDGSICSLTHACRWNRIGAEEAVGLSRDPCLTRFRARSGRLVLLHPGRVHACGASLGNPSLAGRRVPSGCPASTASEELVQGRIASGVVQLLYFGPAEAGCYVPID